MSRDGHLGNHGRPSSFRRFEREPTAEQSDSFLHSDQPEPLPGSAPAPKPCPSSSITAVTEPPLLVTTMLTRVASACFATFVSASCTIR